MHLRTVLATLGLGFLGAALTSGVSAAAYPLAAGLASGVAGNIATDLFKHLDRKVCERFLDGWSGIDENHHVVAALRLAQIDALRALTAKFEDSLGKEDNRLGDQAGFGFAARVRSFLSEEAKVAQARSFSAGSADIEARKTVIALLPETFDDALAARRDSSERGEAGSAIVQVRSVTETAVLDELRARCGDSARRIPVAFEDLFLGKEGVPGWFDLFVRDAADKLTHPNSEFAAIWNAEQTALIKAYVEATSATSEASFQAIESLRSRFVESLPILASVQIKLDAVHAAIDLGFKSQSQHRDEDRADLQRILGIVQALQAASLRPSLTDSDTRKVEEAIRSPDPELRRSAYLSRKIVNMARATHELVLDMRRATPAASPVQQANEQFRDKKFEGDLLRAEGNLAAAVDAYEGALAIDPMDGFATAALANALVDLALRHRPDGGHWIDNRNAFGVSMDRAGRLILPFMDDRCGASIDARVATIWAFSRIWFEFAQRNLGGTVASQQSTDALKKAESLNPRDPITLRLLGRNAHLLLKDRVLAEEYFKRAVSVDSAGVDSKFFYALFLAEVGGREPEAEQMFELCLLAEPDDPNVLEAFAFFLSGRPKRETRAELLWKHSLRVFPQHPVGWLHYGRFLSKRAESAIQAKQADAGVLAGIAEDTLKSGLSHRPNDGRLWCEYSVLLEHIKGREGDAIAAYEKALAWQPDADEPYVRLAMLRILVGSMPEPTTVGLQIMNEGMKRQNPRLVIAGAWLGLLFGHNEDRIGALELLKSMKHTFGEEMQFIIQSRVISHAIAAGNPYGPWLTNLADVIGGVLPLSALSGWGDWMAI